MVLNGAPAWTQQAVTLGRRQLETRVRSLQQAGQGRSSWFCRSPGRGVEPFRQLRASVGLLALFCLAATVVGSVLIARKITRPIRSLAQAALRIQAATMRGGSISNHGEIGAFAAPQSHAGGDRLARGRDRRLAYRDPLTDLPNRAQFLEELEQAIAECGRAGRPSAFC